MIKIKHNGFTAFISAFLTVMIFLSATLGLVVSNETQMRELLSGSGENKAGSALAQTSGLFFAVMPDETAFSAEENRGEKTDRLMYLLPAFCASRPLFLYLSAIKNKIIPKTVLTETVVLLE